MIHALPFGRTGGRPSEEAGSNTPEKRQREQRDKEHKNEFNYVKK
jgi:hypothetical protein